MQKTLPFIFFLGALAYLPSCQEPEIGVAAISNQEQVYNREQFSNSICAQSTLVKPQVDILFLFDNSTSSFYLNPATRALIYRALRSTVYTASQKFDFRIMVAPLIPSQRNPMTSGVSLVAENEKGISSAGRRLIVGSSDGDLVERAARITAISGSQEYGFERVHDLIQHHQSSTGIFRRNAYTLVALFSNEDANWRQSGTSYQGATPIREDFKRNLDQLKNLSNSILGAQQFRLVTVVPGSNNCFPLARRGTRYRQMSEAIYLHNKSKADFFDPTPVQPYDNFDLCSKDYQGIFNRINETISETVLAHKYGHWPITSSRNLDIDPDSITVYKHFSDTSFQRIPESRLDGWTFLNGYQTQNTRIEPTPGEPFSGHLIKLHGTAQVTFPECIRVESAAPFDYFGYYASIERPELSTVTFKKNGASFSESKTNGWEYIGFRSNFNIKIRSQTNHAPASDPVKKTGYFFKLYGNAIYRNGDQVEVKFLPAPFTN